MSFSKQRRETGNPVQPPSDSPHFEPIPQIAPANLELPLAAVLPDIASVASESRKLVFHSVGDTGGIHGTVMQEAIATVMEAQIDGAPAGSKPSFFYHLGDVVYFNGISTEYVSQFYEPYQYYPGPIFAIPGNHDGDRRVHPGDAPDNEPSLFGFMRNFCSPAPQDYFKHRPTMTQPHCYWTLDAPYLRIIGLYSNVDGQIDGRGTVQQQTWLRQQLASCPKDKWLVIAVHHPCFSLDSAHGGYQEILDALDNAAKLANRWPDAVLSGHVHNYQRFSRKVSRHQIPYIVAGAGGYPSQVKSIHQLQKDLPRALPIQTTRDDLLLEAFNCEDSGFLRVTVEPQTLTFDYFAVPFSGEPSPDAFDSVVVKSANEKTP